MIYVQINITKKSLKLSCIRILKLLIRLRRMHDFIEVNTSLMNKSTAKQLYSFPKSIRFQKSLQSPCKSSFYESRVTALGRRTTTFGFGNKITLQNKQKVPPPGQYDRQGEFNMNIKKRRGYSFKHDKNRAIINEEEVVKIPGPGKYSYQTDGRAFRNVSFSMRSKLDDPMSKHQNLLGPGQYSTIPSLTKDGKYYLAKYESSGCPKIGNSKRFQNYQTVSPGPGNYSDNKVTDTNKSGFYFYSNYKSKKANSFCISPRPSLANKSEAPGPGQYGYFSEFPSKDKRR